jgi:enoyl-CoA hydratase/carnithine racemase
MSAQVAARASIEDAPLLLRENVGSIAVITFNRPSQRNTLSEQVIAALHASLNEIAADQSIRALVIASQGPAFSSGHDLKQLTSHRGDADGGRAYFAQTMNACSAMMQAIVNLPKPVIAAVQGIATAAGCQLVASCDLAIASDASRFATSGIDNGLFCSTPMVALSRNVSRKHAMEMLMTGDMISAERAREIGLVNHVVAAGHERDTAIALAQKIARKSAYAIKLGKQAFYQQAGMDLAGAYRLTAEVMTENMMAFDAIEGIGAFIEKREPKWQDK